MSRLDKDRQKKLEPIRMSFALSELKAMGFEPEKMTDDKIIFLFKGYKVTFFAYSGWHTGKSIKDGRGWNNLKKQLVNKD